VHDQLLDTQTITALSHKGADVDKRRTFSHQ